MSALMQETLRLPAFAGLHFFDAWSDQPITSGLRTTLRRKRDGAILARSVVTPSGIHHWPDLAAPWRNQTSTSPSSASLAEILVEDPQERFLPLRLDWPLTPNQPKIPLQNIRLFSAPQRPVPAGAASVFALLSREDETPAAFARVAVTDAQGHRTAGMSDEAGKLTLHFAFPRPDRRPGLVSPSSPNPIQAIAANLTLAVFHDPSVAGEARDIARRFGGGLPIAPLLSAWSGQNPVLALAKLNTTTPFQLRIEPGKPCVLRTQGLPSDRSELRLVPP